MGDEFMTEKKEEPLVEITEREFLKSINNSLEALEQEILDIETHKMQFYSLYKNYSIDKNTGQKIIYYRQGNSIMYDISDNHVGFKYGKSTI